MISPGMLVPFLIAGSEQLQQEGFLLAHSFKGYSPSWRRCHHGRELHVDETMYLELLRNFLPDSASQEAETSQNVPQGCKYQWPTTAAHFLQKNFSKVFTIFQTQ